MRWTEFENIAFGTRELVFLVSFVSEVLIAKLFSPFCDGNKRGGGNRTRIVPGVKVFKISSDFTSPSS